MTANIMKSQAFFFVNAAAPSLRDAEEQASVAAFRPGPEPGQRPTAPRAAASRPPAVVPLPSSRVNAAFGTARPKGLRDSVVLCEDP